MYNDLIMKYYVKGLYLEGSSIHKIHLLTRLPVSKIKEILNK